MGVFILPPKQTMVPGFPVNNYYTKAQSDAKFAPIGGGGSSPSIGGTITSGTTGSILFVNPTATIAQDNNNFYIQDSATTPTQLATNTNVALSINTGGDFGGTDAINIYSVYDAYLPNSVITNSLAGLNTDGATPGYSASSSRGTGASPSQLQANDMVGGYFGWGAQGASSPTYQNLGGMAILTTGVSTNNLGGELRWYTKGDGGSLVNWLALTNAGVLTSTLTALGTTTADSMLLQNTTAAANGAQQVSPAIHWSTFGWGSGGGTSQAVDFRAAVLPVQGVTPSGTWQLMASTSGGAYANVLQVTSGGSTSSGLFFSTTGATSVAFQSTSTLANANFATVSTGIASSTTATLLFAGATTINFRDYLGNGSTSSSIGIGNAYGGTIFGSAPVTMPASGTTPLLANVVINPVGTVTNGSAIAVTNTASLYIGGQSAAGTSNYGIYLNAGTLGLGGNISSTAWTTNGVQLSVAAATLTDTTSSGTVAVMAASAFASSTYIASSATTYTTAATVYITGSPIASTNVTITNSFPLYVANGVAALTGGIATNVATSQSNFNAASGNSAGATVQAPVQFGGSTNINYRVLLNGNSSTTMATGNNYVNFVVGSDPITTFSSGTHAWLANSVINPLGTVTSGGATVTNTTSLYVSGLVTIGTNNYTLYVNAGTLATGGALSKAAWGLNGVNVQTIAATYTDSSTASGTVTNNVINSFGIPTIAATNASITYTNTATVYIAGAPVAGTNATLTNKYGLWSAGTGAAANRYDGQITFPFNSTTVPAIACGDGTDANSWLLTAAAGRVMYGYHTNDSNGNEAMIFNAGASKGIDFYVNGTNSTFLTGTNAFWLLSDATVHLSNKITTYNGITAVGQGVPAIYGTGRSTAQTAAVASVATYTVGAADGSFLVSANVLVTTATVHSFTATVTYTDEGNTSRTVTLQFSTVAGAFVTAMTNAQGTVPYEGVPLHIRAKASTAITIATTGTFTTVTYNVEGTITQIS